jgi:hypothetical protein
MTVSLLLPHGVAYSPRGFCSKGRFDTLLLI